MQSLMRIKDAAKYLQLHHMTVYKLAQRGKIPACKVGGNWRFQKELLDEWLERESISNKLSILIIDDNPRVRDTLSEIVTTHNCVATMAENGETALNELGKQHFDLVFLDLVLPGLGGVEVLREIKEKYRDTIVVVVTGYGDDAIAVEAMTLGPLLLIRKPFQKKDILEVLNMVNKVTIATTRKP